MAWVLQLPGVKLRADVMNAAASKGHTEMCKYLHAQQCPWNSLPIDNAAYAGHVDLLRWLVNNGCPWYVNPLRSSAVRGGSVEVLVFVQQLGVLTSTKTLTDMLYTAGSNNKLAAAKWLKERGAEWPRTSASWWGRAVLDWALSEGFAPSN
jgi:Ankyrin repeats (many copies)